MASRLRLGFVTDSHRDWEQRTGQRKRAEHLLFVDMDIVDTVTGEVRQSIDKTGFRVEDGDVEDAVRCARYMWLQGNYACDCNRSLYFARAAGVEIDREESASCDGERYQIIEPDWAHVVVDDVASN